MQRDSERGRWRFVDGSDVPASFEYEWKAGGQGFMEDKFMIVACDRGSRYFGQIRSFSNNSWFNFICQHQLKP